jgi:chemosensory pili system protein ChpC
MAAEPGQGGFRELYSLLVPLAGARLIVPRVCVAEVTGVGQLRLLEDDPAWLVGTVSWQGREVPLVSFEALCGGPPPELGSRARGVIFHAGPELHGGYFAVMSQGLPQLVRVNPEVVSPDEAQTWHDDAPVICRIRMINEFPVVPDLAGIERRLAGVADRWR